RAQSVREVEQLGQTLGELVGCEIVCVRAKGGMLPRPVRRVGIGASPSAERLDPPVLDVRGAKRAGEGFTCELRVASRAGEAADVHKQLDVECVQYVDELCARPRRVADGPDGWRITSVGSGRGRLR